MRRSKRRAELQDSMQALLDRCEAEKRDLGVMEDLAYRVADDRLTWIQEEMDKRTQYGKKDPIPVGKPGEQGMLPVRLQHLLPGNRGESTGKEWRSLFPNPSPAGFHERRFQSLADFFQAVLGGKDERLVLVKPEARTNVVGSGVAGGFAVPDYLTEMIMDEALMHDEIFRPRCLVLPMEGPTIQAPVFDTEDRSSRTFAGLELKF